METKDRTHLSAVLSDAAAYRKPQTIRTAETDENYRELLKHGTKELPMESYQNNCRIFKSVYSHWHKEMEIMYIEKGCGIAQLNKETLLIKKGDILLINSGTLHHIKSDRRNILYFKSVVFDLSFLSGTPGDLCQEQILSQIMENQARFVHLIHPEDSGYSQIRNLFSQIFDSHRKKADFFYMELKGLFYQFFFQMLTHNYIVTESPKDRKNLAAVKDAIRYMNEHYKEEINASDLAGLSFYNETYFMKLFKQYTGKTLTRYLTELRIEKSRYLLLHTDLSITDIAFETGFNSASYFIRKFQELNGETPQKLRKQNL
ncbi:MAG: helix-turn-helix domain-containing protein [Lachnospiraceae bacterium]|nr:helix-turn-helix domain-containing protein [Lachnospiraceae bacterium]